MSTRNNLPSAFVLDFNRKIEHMIDLYCLDDEWCCAEEEEMRLRNKLKEVALDRSVSDVDYFECLYRFETACYMDTSFSDVEAVVRGFEGDFSERVPDHFFIKIMQHWRPEDATVDDYMRTVGNTSPELRRIYAYWKTSDIENKYDIVSSIYSLIVQAVFKRIKKDYIEARRYHSRMMWKTEHRPRTNDHPPLRSELLNAILDPKRIERVGLDVVKRMILPIGDDEIVSSYSTEAHNAN
jgi:hypothetical protein